MHVRVGHMHAGHGLQRPKKCTPHPMHECFVTARGTLKRHACYTRRPNPFTPGPVAMQGTQHACAGVVLAPDTAARCTQAHAW
jgi:hypothetical protein